MNKHDHKRNIAKKKGEDASGQYFKLFQSLITAASKLRDEFYKFLLLTAIALILGGSGIAFAFGCIMGVLVIGLVIFFILTALYMRWRFEPKK